MKYFILLMLFFLNHAIYSQKKIIDPFKPIAPLNIIKHYTTKSRGRRGLLTPKTKRTVLESIIKKDSIRYVFRYGKYYKVNDMLDGNKIISIDQDSYTIRLPNESLKKIIIQGNKKIPDFYGN